MEPMLYCVVSKNCIVIFQLLQILISNIIKILLTHACNDIKLNLKQKKNQSGVSFYCFNDDTDNHDSHNLISPYYHSNRNNGVNLI